MLPAPCLYPKAPDLRLFLAPMAGITDIVFRSLMRENGAQVVISELLSAEGLIRGGERTHQMLQFSESERPVGIQIFGSKMESMVEAAQIVEAKGADFVDINFGCPVKKVVCDGAGAAWLRDPKSMVKMLSEIAKAIRIPLTIKIRTGWDEKSINALEIVKGAEQAGVKWVAIHGRTRAQGYSGLADWDLIREVAWKSPIPIIGNGDVISAEQARMRLEQGYCHAIMIGRGALKNPWVFRQFFEKDYQGSISDLIERHFDLALQYKDRMRAFLSLKKFLGWYSAGFPESSQFRKRLFELEEIEALKTMALDYFCKYSISIRREDSQPFLMGGHG